MKLAIMQPYFFPYIGYFQLINAVDKFVVYDDVNFIKKGWINRNYILLNERKHLITIPLEKQSQNRVIRETNLGIDEKWKRKTLKTIEVAYKKAPFFNDVFKIISETLDMEASNISNLNVFSIKNIINYLHLDVEIIESSTIYSNAHLKAQERILDICLRENAKHYINPGGGKDLYDKDLFRSKDIQLSFINSKPFNYRQFTNEFVPWLSIIDVLMFNSKEKIRNILQEYKLE